MHIEWLQVRNVRNLCDVRIEPDAQANVICGANGSGKTALLEAIYLLGRCRSFRCAGVNSLIRRRQAQLQVCAGLRTTDSAFVVTGVERSRGALSIRYGNREIRKVSEQAAQVPIITFTPSSDGLITGGPKSRRRWLDWAMFHVEPNYVEIWRAYHRALKHRNSLLKRRASAQLGAWEKLMAEAATKLNRLRMSFLDELCGILVGETAQLEAPGISLKYQCGWPAETDLDLYLAECRDSDLETGVTRYGLHRSDLQFSSEGRSVAKFYSAGQIKLALAALLLAQALTFKSRAKRNPILLVDDLPAELDEDNCRRIVKRLSEYDGQVFMTTTGESSVMSGVRQKMFHVKQGRFVT